MVISLKDGSTVTLFDAIEAKEIIGHELYDFIEKKIKYSYNEKDEKIHELECENDDLYCENINMIHSLDKINELANEALDVLGIIKRTKNNSYSLDEIKNILKDIKDYTS